MKLTWHAFLLGCFVLYAVGVCAQDIITPAGQAVHRFATDVQVSNQLTAQYNWDFGDPAGEFNTLTGWNVAHLYEKPGNYSIRLNVVDGTKTTTLVKSVRVDPAVRVNITASSGSSLASAVGKSSVFIDVPNDITYGSINITGSNIVLEGHGHKLTSTLTSGAAINTASSSRQVVFRNFKFAGFPSTHFRPAGQNLTLVNCEFLEGNYGFNGEAMPDGIFLQKVSSRSLDRMKKYLAYMKGKNWVFLGCEDLNSVDEHCIRGNLGSNINIQWCRLQNIDEPGPTYSKGTVTLQMLDHVWVENNDLVLIPGDNGKWGGDGATGPLGVDTQGRTTFTRWHHNYLQNGAQLLWRYGTVHAAFVDNASNYTNRPTWVHFDSSNAGGLPSPVDVITANNIISAMKPSGWPKRPVPSTSPSTQPSVEEQKAAIQAQIDLLQKQIQILELQLQALP